MLIHTAELRCIRQLWLCQPPALGRRGLGAAVGFAEWRLRRAAEPRPAVICLGTVARLLVAAWLRCELAKRLHLYPAHLRHSPAR